MNGTEARHLLTPWVREHRQVACMFGTLELNDAGSCILWSLDATLLTIRRFDGSAEGPVDLHIPLSDAAMEYFEPTEAPADIRPAKPLEWFDGAVYLHEPELSEGGAAIELRWAVWIANAKWQRKELARGHSA